ncbi:MAG: hypothetical protein K8S54_10960 [Spirochaetia bacterium]|nr:hypothetical protein [Spirochaetia bacterium]
MRFKIERLGLICAVLCFVSPVWYLFPLYPLASFLLLASSIEFILSLGLAILFERDQIGTRQRDIAEFLIRVLGLPLTIVAFSSGPGLTQVALLRTFFSTVSVGLISIRRLMIFYFLMAIGHILFLFFRDSLFSLSAAFQVYPACLLALAAATGVRYWIVSERLRKRAQILLLRFKRDLTASKQSALNLLRFNFKREEGSLFLRGGLVPGSSIEGVLASFYFRGMERVALGPGFDREWEQFIGRLTQVFSGLEWRWDGTVLRFYGEIQAPGTLARIAAYSSEALAFAKKTEAYHTQANRTWPWVQVLISTGTVSQISAGPGVPLRLLIGPVVSKQNEFAILLLKGRNPEIVVGSKFPIFSGDLAEFCNTVFLRETLRPIEDWILPGEWRREILERGSADLADRILSLESKPNQS